nr:hypothetical protein [uncultured Trichococcus sp.]
MANRKTIEVTIAEMGGAEVFQSSRIEFKTDPGEIKPLYIYIYSEDGKLMYHKPWYLGYLAFCDYESIGIEFSRKELELLEEYGSKRKLLFWRMRHKKLIEKLNRLSKWVEKSTSEGRMQTI